MICDVVLKAEMMKCEHDTPSSDYVRSFIKLSSAGRSCGPEKQKHLTIYDQSWGDEMCDTQSSDDAYVYQASLNYLERTRSYETNNKNFTDVQTIP